MASWHRVREARRHEGTKARRQATSRRRGFSLIEVLLSVFILGIGVISIAALFPAGIAQQRQSVDDITGPIVAQNALAILRTKLRPADFGTLEEFGSLSATIEGDFGWSRPAFFTSETDVNGFPVRPGSILIFNDSTLPNLTNGEIWWNRSRYGLEAPTIIFTQRERYYPMRSLNSADPRPPKPQYVWDCMFRRFQGKVMVAIFVYRTTIVGGGDVAYRVPENPSNPNLTLMPMTLPLPDPWDTYGLSSGNTPADDALILGTDPYNTADQFQSWQEPGQWILDQNNNLHRVLSRYRNDDDLPVVELIRPVPTMPVLPVYFLLNTGNQGVQDVVSSIWYIPREVTLDGVPVRLTAVYVTVREL
ncbi:MAG: prepilin-type N-terminal cleavage/methylation domain-containing protein [Phycisphaerales bacterium]